MKVILLKDIAKVGKKFEVKDIADGHALNFLIPKGDAKAATPSALKELDTLKAAAEAEKKVQEDLLSKTLHEIDGKAVEISLPANNKGHLFAGVHQTDVAQFIKKSQHVEILPDFIELPKPIKEVGEHEIHVVAGGKKATVKLVIEAK